MVGTPGGAAGDRQSDFLTDRDAGEVEDVAADAGELRRVREVDNGGGGPCRPAVDPAVTAFGDEVVRFGGQQRQAPVPYFLLQDRLVPFDCHDVVETAFARDVLGGFSLRVRGVKGDQHAPVLLLCDVLKELADLGDLVRAVGHPGLGDRHGPPVDHRGEQGDLVVGLGPGSAQDLAV